ncbi:MAG: acyl-ACP desaturase [Rhodococcus sp. (in: high G+C Gram-positive bacteria)]
MPQVLSQTELLRELQPVAESNLNRHLSLAKPWNPHDYVPWSDGKNFAMLGGQDWSPEQSSLSKVAKAAMVTNLLTEDNLPSYHRGLAENFSLDGAWGTWVGRWTAEENRHGIAMRDYLVVTRSVDPVALEQARMEHMTVGIDSPMEGANLLHGVAYVTFQELATRVSHRNTGKACNDPIADALLARIAADENLHMIFYRNMCSAALELAPDQTMKAIADIVMNFQMPGLNQPDFRRNAVLIAKYGIYDLRQHLDEVIMPVLRKWDIFERTDFGPEGEHLRELVADYLADLEKQAVRFEESRDRSLAREAARGDTPIAV